MTVADTLAPRASATPATPAAATASAGGRICALPIGMELGGYRLVRVIGHGGFGIVYEAIDVATGAQVAIKEYMPVQLAARPAGEIVLPLAAGVSDAYELGQQGFLEEAALLRRYRHPGLIHALASWEQNGTAYMAMPFYDGATLEQIMQRDRSVIDERWLKTLLGPILGALESLHADRCCHRDVSPDNILVPNAGGAVLLDLGAARRIIGGQARALTVMLKSGFAPIEQYADDPSLMPGPWSDIYALCGVLYFAITGNVPPASASRVMRENFVPLRELAPAGYSAEFLSAIDAGLAVRPDDRPRTIAAFRQRVFAEPGSLAAMDEASRKGKRRRMLRAAGDRRDVGGVERWPRGARIVIGVALAAFVFGGGWLGRGGGRDGATKPADPVPAAVTMRAPAVPAPSAVIAPSVPDASSASGASGASGASEAPLDVASPAVEVDERVGMSREEVAHEEAPRADAPHGDTPHGDTPPGDAPRGDAPRGDMTRRDMTRRDMPRAQAPHERAADVRPAAAALAPAAAGRLSLSVHPWAEVVVDGQRKGVSPPLTSLPLEPGRHRVELRNSGAPVARFVVDVQPGRTASIRHRFP